MSGCNCEAPSCYTALQPKARKEHRCYECREIIPAGSQYRLFSGIWDGHAATYRFCERCKKLRDYLENGKDCICFGGLHEALAEEMCDGNFPPTELLSQSWKQMAAKYSERYSSRVDGQLKANPNL